MTNAGSIIAGYGITIVTVVAYAWWIVQRGRSIGRELGIGDAEEQEGTETWT